MTGYRHPSREDAERAQRARGRARRIVSDLEASGRLGSRVAGYARKWALYRIAGEPMPGRSPGARDRGEEDLVRRMVDRALREDGVAVPEDELKRAV